MRFFHNTDSADEDINHILFQEGCKELGIEYIELNPSTFDINKYLPITSSDIYYRSARDLNARQYENYFVQLGVTTLLKDSTHLKRGISAIIHELNGVPIPKTVYRMTKNVDSLKADVDFLGGFPIILKSLGGTGGSGIVKVESFESLLSLTGLAISKKIKYILREFVDSEDYGRLIVLGNKVVASKHNDKQKEDFRTNDGYSYEKKYSSEIEETAVKAVHLIGREFGGVDVLVRNDGSFVILEVNFPCGFYHTQKVTGINISKMMLEYLKEKAEKSNPSLHSS